MEQRVVEMAHTRGQHDDNCSYHLLPYLMPIIVPPALYGLCHLILTTLFIRGNKIGRISSLSKVPVCL